ncbi:MAG TPA: hypothetical protein VIR30_12845 [Nocardioides sp.]
MSTPIRLAGYVAILVVALLGAYGIGNAVGPIGGVAQDTHHETAGDVAASQQAVGATLPGGLQSSAQGYTLHLLTPILEPGTQTLRFHILDAAGEPVTAYDVTHEAALHFFAVRRDLSGFAHLHPTMDDSGTWQVEVDLTPGTWRFLADFRPTGATGSLTLGHDGFVAGDFEPRPLPAAEQTVEVDGYAVTLSGDLRVGGSSELSMSISNAGRPVIDLEPYLGAYGHLVALREGDLAYLHVHPRGAPEDDATEPGPRIAFGTSAPSAGAYRLFLDFKHDGVVRTAAFTVHAESDTTAHDDGADHEH